MSRRVAQTALLAFVVLCIIFSATPGRTADQPAKTLKIGLIMFLGWDLGINSANGIELLAELMNKKGGLQVGQEKYRVEIIKYDSKFTPETARAAAERLIYQDKVKFILGDETIDAWVPVTEQNKVLVVAVLSSPSELNPRNKYLFSGTGLQTQMPTTWGWFAKNHPEIKNSVQAFPDNKIGHIRADLAKNCASIFGPALPSDYLIFYPPQATDVSVVGTKAKTLKADGFCATAGGVQGDALAYKAAWQAGYRGQLWSFVETTEYLLEKIIPMEAVEGMIAPQFAADRDPMPPAAKEYVDGWTARNGKWDHQTPYFADLFTIMTEGIKQAKSIDPDKVADVMANGMRFDGVSGSGKMISRPDVGNSRTVDVVYGQVMKQTINGKPKVLGVLTPEDAYVFNKKFWGWK